MCSHLHIVNKFGELSSLLANKSIHSLDRTKCRFNTFQQWTDHSNNNPPFIGWRACWFLFVEVLYQSHSFINQPLQKFPIESHRVVTNVGHAVFISAIKFCWCHKCSVTFVSVSRTLSSQSLLNAGFITRPSWWAPHQQLRLSEEAKLKKNLNGKKSPTFIFKLLFNIKVKGYQ